MNDEDSNRVAVWFKMLCVPLAVPFVAGPLAFVKSVVSRSSSDGEFLAMIALPTSVAVLAGGVVALASVVTGVFRLAATARNFQFIFMVFLNLVMSFFGGWFWFWVLYSSRVR